MSVETTVTLDALRRNLQTRTGLEEAFKQKVIDRINAILSTLRDCDRTGLTPSAASTLDLTQRQLDAFINELTHPNNLTDAEAQRIASTVNPANLRRSGPVSAASPAPSWLSSIFGSKGATPSSGPATPSPIRRDSLYGDDIDVRGSSLYRGAPTGSLFDEPEPGTPSYFQSRPPVGGPPAYNPLLGRRGGWKSPRKRKPRGTKKYNRKV